MYEACNVEASATAGSGRFLLKDIYICIYIYIRFLLKDISVYIYLYIYVNTYIYIYRERYTNNQDINSTGNANMRIICERIQKHKLISYNLRTDKHELHMPQNKDMNP